jgi:membrane protease YdiL (CAAX protease family)
MNAKTRLFLILWAAGFLGVLSFLLVDLNALVAMVPLPDGQSPADLPPPALLKIISLIQPTILVSLAVLIGVLLANRVGLRAPAAEALAAREPFVSKLGPQLLPAILAGIAGGMAIILAWVVAKPYLSAEFISRAQAFNDLLPIPMRFLFGGITEELLLRWGLMTFLVWLPWRLFQKGEGTPKSLFVVAAIFISAILFGVGHLPVASLLAGELTFPLVAYVITAKSVFGIFAGFLYWKRGLESAMIAHMFAHIILVIAISLSL